jgi:hypothetical protein
MYLLHVVLELVLMSHLFRKSMDYPGIYLE